MNKKHFYFSVILAALIGGLVAVAGFYLSRGNNSQELNPFNQRQNVRFSSYIDDPSEFTVPEGLNFVYAAELATPAVVHIRSTYGADASGAQSRSVPQHPLQEMFPDLFRNPGQGSPHGRQGIPKGSSGSGVILSEDGYIVTNNHVIDNAKSIEVVLSDNRQYTAELIGTDPTTDIAVLKIEEENLPFVKYGDSDKIKIGEWVLAVGNPYDLNSTVTAGIVSAKSRSIGILANEAGTGIESFIQTDAAVNPGNSGGALVNLKGELIGVNTAIASPTGSYSGYSFAVPVSLVSKIVEDLKEFGTVQRALLGVRIGNVNAELAKAEGLDVNKGVYVADVSAGSAAEEAGIEKGDVIVEVNGHITRSVAQLQESVALNRPGDKVKVTFYRDGGLNSVMATLKNSMGTTRVVARNAGQVELAGALLSSLSPEEGQELGIEGGVKVENIGNGKWAEAGVEEGFVITAIDNKKVKSTEELLYILKNKRGQGTLVEGIRPNGEKVYYGMPW